MVLKSLQTTFDLLALDGLHVQDNNSALDQIKHIGCASKPAHASLTRTAAAVPKSTYTQAKSWDCHVWQLFCSFSNIKTSMSQP